MAHIYSSSKTAWPTKNLFAGGGPSRPYLRNVKITKANESDKYRIGPTKTRAKWQGEDEARRNKRAFEKHMIESGAAQPFKPQKIRIKVTKPKTKFKRKSVSQAEYKAYLADMTNGRQQ